MPVNIIVGTQWGDEGKGHLTDLLASQADFVARFSGGDNAGHTVAIGSEVYRLHLIPSGVTQPGAVCILGNGMVINPGILLKELDDLSARGVDTSSHRIKISQNAHLITPAHIALDGAHEHALGDHFIGTTKRGIGPAYTDKAARTGLRAGLLTKPLELRLAISNHIKEKNRLLVSLYGHQELDVERITATFEYYSQRLAPYIADTTELIHQAIKANKSILAEGAQGSLLDLDHGTYPYVTSSWPIAAGALVGLGIGPKHIDRVTGVAKAFTSRVGEGPFPSEVYDDMAERLRGTGELPWDEFGTTTGRPRRVGWLDTVILRYTAQLNSLTELALTKLDILSGIDPVEVCYAYEYRGRQISHFQTDLATLAECQPLTVKLPGWSEDIMGTKSFDQLPTNAQKYVDFIAESIEVPIRYISVGPGREHIIIKN